MYAADTALTDRLQLLRPDIYGHFFKDGRSNLLHAGAIAGGTRGRHVNGRRCWYLPVVLEGQRE